MQNQQISETNDMNQPIKILKINSIQDYAWGQTDQNCYVGRMSNRKYESYAQLWMGIHPKGQSKVSEQLSLKQYLKQSNKDELNFLFKILSIKKCLSIQAHPNKKQAEILNNKYPKLYQDDNDKPQMFLTLSQKFQLFLGFVQQKQLENTIIKQPFKSIVVKNKINQKNQYKDKIMSLLEILVRLKQEEVKQNINILLSNLYHFSQKAKIIQRLYVQFNNDVGVLVCCLLNYKVLNQGQCFGIDAGVPHAYIKGQCFQLMNNSDNVVRLGITPKEKDVQNLLQIVSNNFDKRYVHVKLQKLQNQTSFKWNSFEIKIVKLDNIQGNKLNILNNSIGIVLESSNSITISNYKIKNQYQLKQKDVFFIQQGTYLLKGNGNIYIASRN